jgi:glycosyltransferase involved in cell wall biosynthesis
MKILVVNNFFPEHVGGIEYVAYNLVSLLRQKHIVHWMACDVSESPHQSCAGDIPLRCLNVTEKYLGFPYPIPVLTSLPKIFREVKWCDVINIHDCLYAANVLVFILAQMQKKPVLLTQHVSPVSYRKKYKNFLQTVAYGTIGRLIVARAVRIVFISQRVQKWFEIRMGLKRSTSIVMNGVDHRIFYPAPFKERDEIRKRLQFPDKKPIILSVGRFTEKKGLDILREAAERKPDYLWILIGRIDGLDPRLWKLSNVKVLINLFQSELRNYYSIADLIILPSTGEGVPLVLQEAMSCGTPVVVSEELNDSLPDVPLLKLKNLSSNELISLIDEFLSTPQKISDWKQDVFDYAVAHWSWEAAVNAYNNIFRELEINV